MDEKTAAIFHNLDATTAKNEIQKQVVAGNFTAEQAARVQKQYDDYHQQQQEKQEKQRQQHLQNRYQQLLKVIDELGRDHRGIGGLWSLRNYSRTGSTLPWYSFFFQFRNVPNSLHGFGTPALFCGKDFLGPLLI